MKKPILLTLSLFALAGCATTFTISTSSEGKAESEASEPLPPASLESAEPEAEVTWITPTGAPTLAFYDQGDNENWVSTSAPATDLLPSFNANSYDAIVFDGVSGLNLIQKSAGKSHYQLARWINELSFYVVSTKHTAADAFDSSYTVDAFVQSGNASRAFLDLAKNTWNWGDLSANGLGTATFEDGVSTVASHLIQTPESFDYYVVAEPVYTQATAQLKAKGITLNTIYDLQSEWGKAHDGAKIPSAALFVNSGSMTSKEAAMKKFLNETETRIANLIDNPSVAAEALSEYAAEDGHVVNGNLTKFGVGQAIASNLANLQKTNKLGFKKKSDLPDPKAYADAFNESLGGSAFDSSLFLA